MKAGKVGGILLLSTTVSAAAVSADEVLLVGGGRLVGEVVQQGGGSVVIDVGAGRVTLPASRVVRVVSGRSALAVYRDRASRLAPEDAQGWLALGLWARDNDLVTLATDAFRRALAVDPGNEAAHRALGHVSLGGEWMTEDQAYRARGFVQYEGEWMPPEQAQMLAEQKMAEAAARSAAREAAAREREAEARARAAEAEARAAAEAAYDGSIPYGWGFGPGYGPYDPYVVGHGRGPGRRHHGERPTGPCRGASCVGGRTPTPPSPPPPAAPPPRGSFAGVPNRRH